MGRRSSASARGAASSSDARPAAHRDVGAEGDERRARPRGEDPPPVVAIECGGGAEKARTRRIPNAPGRVLDAVFERRAVALSRVAEVVFGDELAFGARLEGLGVSAGARLER